MYKYQVEKSLEKNATTPEWRKKAKCKKINIALFFSSAAADVEDAKIICEACQVKTDCLNWALKKEKGSKITTPQHGILGGADASERMRISRETQEGRYPILCSTCLTFRTPWEEACEKC